MAAEHIVIVGKGGVGKTTTAANLAAALAEAGRRVLLVGYDARWNSTATLRGDNPLRRVSEWGTPSAPLYSRGHHGTLCMEAGELVTNGDAVEVRRLLSHPLVTEHAAEFVVHDVSWEPGAALVLPAAIEGIPRLLVVASADMGAINVVNQTFAWLNTVEASQCRFAGVVVNNLTGPLYESIINDFVSQTDATVVASIPHSLIVSASDFYHQTVVQAAPFSQISYGYRKLARRLEDASAVQRPGFLQNGALREWAVKWGEIISELETGLVREGGSCI